MDRAVVVVAAGSGTRLGIGTAKAFVPVAGTLMLARALDAGRVGRGDTVILCGTAAGLTANVLALRL